MREQRRAELVSAYARVLAEQGQTGATIAAVAAEAGVTPGLVHHHFAGKHDLQSALIDALVARFRGAHEPRLEEYVELTLGLGKKADLVAARAWVALFAEAQSDAVLFRKVRRLLELEVEAIVRRSGGKLRTADACAVMSYIMGSLVFGAFAPQKAPGFSAPRLQMLIDALASTA